MKKDIITELLQDISAAKTELEVAVCNFEFATSAELTDVYAYKIIAARARCDYLLKKAKELGIISSSFQGPDTQFRRYQP